MRKTWWALLLDRQKGRLHVWPKGTRADHLMSQLHAVHSQHVLSRLCWCPWCRSVRTQLLAWSHSRSGSLQVTWHVGLMSLRSKMQRLKSSETKHRLQRHGSCRPLTDRAAALHQRKAISVQPASTLPATYAVLMLLCIRDLNEGCHSMDYGRTAMGRDAAADQLTSTQ